MPGRTVGLQRVAIVGGGVIGAGWAARFVLNGVDVAVVDPNPEIEADVTHVLANARLAWEQLGFPIDRGASVSFCRSIAEAVGDVDIIHESVPERPELKASVLAEIEASARPDTLITSSTSGIRPSTLQADLHHPERFLVAHPFNPVYLLPLVEIVGGARTSDDTITRAKEYYAALGMHPLHVRVEIDAFIADRLLEAMWREALWLVHDGVATTQEIDEAISHGFGLRFAQMGLFETYRTAGGAGGFRHFLQQFGPALDWPWTKLMDTPPFTDELVESIVTQSDEHSGALDVSEMERVRDTNLVGFLRALEDSNWAAGRTIAAHRSRYED